MKPLYPNPQEYISTLQDIITRNKISCHEFYGQSENSAVINCPCRDQTIRRQILQNFCKKRTIPSFHVHCSLIIIWPNIHFFFYQLPGQFIKVTFFSLYSVKKLSFLIFQHFRNIFPIFRWRSTVIIQETSQANHILCNNISVTSVFWMLHCLFIFFLHNTFL